MKFKVTSATTVACGYWRCIAMTNNVDYDIEMVKAMKIALFGDEGLLFATLRTQGESGSSDSRSALCKPRFCSRTTAGRSVQHAGGV
ncbi:hypothetical protein [Bacillus sp. T33-2]|uniref:hypothetical protein n=1 Tax=Bacillus sp. T33-2 TaxID=2054168 RepID=UPI0015E0DAA9